MILTYTFTDASNSTIRRFNTVTSGISFIPVVLDNNDYAALVTAGTPIEPFVFDAVQAKLDFESSIKGIIDPDPFSGVSGTVVVSGGLNLVTNIPNLIINDITTVSADPNFTKNVLISVVYNTVSGTFFVVAREKTTDEFADLLNKELITKDLGEFFVTAGGSTLLPV